MRPETEDRILAKYPWIAGNVDYPSHYHILCDDGWASLIEYALSVMELRYQYHLGHLYITESLGHLHIEAEHPDCSDVLKVLAEIAEISGHICEMCGEVGNSYTSSSGSMKVLCGACAVGRGYMPHESRLLTKARL